MKIRLWGNSGNMSDAKQKRLAESIRANANLPKNKPIEFVKVTEKEMHTAVEKRTGRGSD